ncbi:transcriptional regulator [Paenisporosarcina quisquiliarum]|nr:transcriptional regulator [Paenisporosarcina quisquiliarum]
MLSIRLKASRKALKLTQEDLAVKVNTTKGTISNYENGHSTPSNEMLVLLAEVLNTTPNYLLGVSEHKDSVTSKAGITDNEQEEIEFQAFANDPSLQKWYKELPQSEEEDLQKLRKMWEIIKNDVNN